MKYSLSKTFQDIHGSRELKNLAAAFKAAGNEGGAESITSCTVKTFLRHLQITGLGFELAWEAEDTYLREAWDASPYGDSANLVRHVYPVFQAG